MATFPWFEQAIQDLRFAVRNLAASPGFATLAVASLALGIMATTAMYSVVHAVVIDPFPYKDVDQLMSVRVQEAGRRGGRTGYSTDQFLEIAERSTIFEGVIASTISDVLWTTDGEPQRLRGNHVTTNTFDVMGVPPLMGRAVTLADGAPDAPVVVLGHRFWQRQFGGDAGILGRTMTLNGVVRTVVGVMPRRFMWRGADVYVPIVFERGKVVDGVRFVHLLGRLKPGVTEAQAEQDLRPIIQDLQKREPSQFPERWRVGLLPFKETFPSSIRETLWILFGAVGLLLLIACVNVSNLLLSRGAAREREMAVRSAIGASRGRILRQLLTESLLLAAIGGAVGVPLAYAGLHAIIALVPPDTIPDESEVVINAAVLWFAVAISVVTALVFGLAPAWQASRTALVESLKEGGRGASGGGRRQAFVRNALVVAEVALSVMLLVGASLMLRTLVALQQVDLGIRPDRVLTLRVPLPERRYPEPSQRIAFFRELLDRVGSIPGVNAAGLNSGLHPFGGWNMPVEVPGGRQQDSRGVVLHQVSADYTRAMGIGLLRGRLLTSDDLERALRVAVVNESFTRRYLDGQEPLGRVVRMPNTRRPPFDLQDDSFEIVGVVRDTVNRGLTNEVQPEIYVPYTLTGLSDRLVVQTTGDPTGVVDTVRRQVYALDPEQPVTQVRTMDALLDDFVFAGARFSFVLFLVFAALGLTLAVVGVYGVIAHAVSRRTQEIGLRLALGASGGRIVGMVLSSGFKLIATGLVLGLIGSAAAARVLRQMIWNISPVDPISFAIVSAVLLVAGLQACLWPAVRAMRVNPVAALRTE
jgi:putative ABC transport system permease protein